MPKYWFTSDLHLGHAKIIDYTNRPFTSVGEMDSKLIKNWNSRVGDDDLVFHIGDFCFKGEKKFQDYRNQLAGNIIFIRGNHDKNNSTKTNIESITLYYARKWLLLCHRPEDAMFYSHLPRYDLILCGHVHNHWKFKHFRKQEPDYCNVGVDVWGFMPVDIQEILKEYWKWKNK